MRLEILVEGRLEGSTEKGLVFRRIEGRGIGRGLVWRGRGGIMLRGRWKLWL